MATLLHIIEPDIATASHTSEPDIATVSHTSAPDIATLLHTSELDIATVSHIALRDIATVSHIALPDIATVLHQYLSTCHGDFRGGTGVHELGESARRFPGRTRARVVHVQHTKPSRGSAAIGRRLRHPETPLLDCIADNISNIDDILFMDNSVD
jgi:hypothetical protein